jgi:GT2 family glycosyltransferase
LLLYPDERVQHGGMYLGFDERAGHTLRGAALPEEDYLFNGVAPRETSCLTGAVLLVERSAFEAINGFDEQLATYLQDVDLGLRLHRIGLRNVFDPTSVLIHMESASIRSLEARSAFHRQRAAEFARFQTRWGAAVTADRFHPPGFDLADESLHRLSGARGVRPPMKDGLPLPAAR